MHTAEDFQCSECRVPYYSPNNAVLNVKSERKNYGNNSVEVRIPYILNGCNHSFCQLCLSHLLLDGNIKCPSCQVLSSANSNGIEFSFSPDFYLLGKFYYHKVLQKEYRFKHEVPYSGKIDNLKKSVACKECNKNSAEKYCKNCQLEMCEDCFHDIHQSSRVLASHESLKLVPNFAEGFLNSNCEQHLRKLEYFCCEDGELVCSKCCIGGDHLKHKIIPIQESNKQILPELAPLIDRAVTVMGCFCLSEQEVDRSVEIAKSSLTETWQKMNATFHNLHAQLAVREFNLQKELYSEFQKGTEELFQMKKYLVTSYSRAKLLIEECHVAMAEHGECNFAVMQLKTLLERLVEKDCYWPLSSVEDISCQFHQQNLFDIPDIGKVSVICSQWPKLLPSAMLPPDMEVPVNQINFCSTQQKRRICSSGTDADEVSAASMFPSNNVVASMHGVRPELWAPRSVLLTMPFLEKSFLDDRANIKMMSNPQKIVKNQNVIVTHVHSPVNFFVQLMCEHTAIAQLQREIAVHVNSSLAAAVPHLHPGMLVLVQFSSDKGWYRALIMSVDDLKCNVLYVDYGNSEQVLSERILAIPSDLEDPAHFAWQCALYGISSTCEDKSWPSEVTKAFHKVVSGRMLFMNVRQAQKDLLFVDLCFPTSMEVSDDDVSTVQHFLHIHDYVNFDEALSAPRTLIKKNILVSPSRPKKGEIFRAMIVSVDTPDSFCIQKLDEDGECYAEMTREMKKFYEFNNSLNMMVPSRCRICAVLYDEVWHRGKVLDVCVEENVVKVHVLLLDIGITHNFPLDDIKKLVSSFCKLSIQALSTCMSDVQPIAKTWSDAACDFLRAFRCVPLMVQIICVNITDSTCSVVLYDSNDSKCISINNLLIQSGLACSCGATSSGLFTLPEKLKPLLAGPLETKDNSQKAQIKKNKKHSDPSYFFNEFMVEVTHLVHPGRLFLRKLPDDLNALVHLESLMVSAYLNTTSTNVPFSAEDFVAVIGAQESHRGVVKLVKEHSVTVDMIDFGFHVTIPLTDIRPLLPEFMKLAPLCFRATLSGVLPPTAEGWTSASTKFVQDMLSRRSVVYCTKKIQTKFGFSYVCLGVEKSCLDEELDSTPDRVDISGALLQKNLATERSYAGLPACIT